MNDMSNSNKTDIGGQGQIIEAETFRDSVGTMDNTGKRKWVFPRKPKGKYTNYRNIVSVILLMIFFILSFIIESYGNGFNQLLNPCLSNKSRKEQLYIPGFSAHNLNGGA